MTQVEEQLYWRPCLEHALETRAVSNKPLQGNDALEVRDIVSSQLALLIDTGFIRLECKANGSRYDVSLYVGEVLVSRAMADRKGVSYLLSAPPAVAQREGNGRAIYVQYPDPISPLDDDEPFLVVASE